MYWQSKNIWYSDVDLFAGLIKTLESLSFKLPHFGTLNLVNTYIKNGKKTTTQFWGIPVFYFNTFQNPQFLIKLVDKWVHMHKKRGQDPAWSSQKKVV